MISMAIQKGDYVEIYDRPGHYKTRIYAPVRDGGLQGYTSSCVNIRKGSYIESYDENGRYLSRIYAR